MPVLTVYVGSSPLSWGRGPGTIVKISENEVLVFEEITDAEGKVVFLNAVAGTRYHIAAEHPTWLIMHPKYLTMPPEDSTYYMPGISKVGAVFVGIGAIILTGPLWGPKVFKG